MVRGGGTYCLEACPEPAIGRGDGVWEAVDWSRVVLCER